MPLLERVSFFSLLKCQPRLLQLLRLIKRIACPPILIGPDLTLIQATVSSPPPLNQLSLSPRQPLERFSCLLPSSSSPLFLGVSFHVGVLSMWPNRAWLFPLGGRQEQQMRLGENITFSQRYYIYYLGYCCCIVCTHTYTPCDTVMPWRSWIGGGITTAMPLPVQQLLRAN